MSFNRKAGLYFGVKHETVGKEDGFTPGTFFSSRSQRRQQQGGESDAAARRVSTVRDFMDEDDGLLGGVLSTRAGVDAFASGPRLASNHAAESHDLGGFVFRQLGLESQSDVAARDQLSLQQSIQRLLSQAVSTPEHSIGKKLLQQLGWKDGQGIGARVFSGRLSNLDDSQASAVSLAANASLSESVPAKAMANGMVTFAPKDQSSKFLSQSIAFARVDHSGLGYKAKPRLTDRSSDLPTHGHALQTGDDSDDDDVGLFGNRLPLRKGMTAIASQGQRSQRRYQVNDLFAGHNRSTPHGSSHDYLVLHDEDDEDIAYGAEDKSRFDIAVSAAHADFLDERHEDTTRTPEETSSSQTQRDRELNRDLQRCLSDSRVALLGFHVSVSSPQLSSTTMTILAPPPTFVPRHVFSEASRLQSAASSAVAQTTQSGNAWKVDPAQRLRERQSRWSTAAEESVGSAQGAVESSASPVEVAAQSQIATLPKIFELMKPEDRARLQQLFQSSKQLSETDAPSATLGAELENMPKLLPEVTNPVAEQEKVAPDRPMLISQQLRNSASLAMISSQLQNRFAPAADVKDSSAAEPKPLGEGLTTAEQFASKMREEKDKKQALEDVKQKLLARSGQSAKVKKPTKPELNRMTSVWMPSSLLCKRFGVKPPDPAVASQLVTSMPIAPQLVNKDRRAADSQQDMFQRLFDSSVSTENDNAQGALSFESVRAKEITTVLERPIVVVAPESIFGDAPQPSPETSSQELPSREPQHTNAIEDVIQTEETTSQSLAESTKPKPKEAKRILSVPIKRSVIIREEEDSDEDESKMKRRRMMTTAGGGPHRRKPFTLTAAVEQTVEKAANEGT